MKMSKLIFNASLFYLYLCILSENVGVASSDAVHFYEVKPIRQSSHISFEYLTDRDHHIEKRQISENKTKPLIEIKSGNFSSQLNETKASETKEPPKIFPKDAPRLNVTATTLPQAPIAKERRRNPVEEPPRLLGVNGTGQRKEYPSAATSTTKPTVILTTREPDDVGGNNSATANNFDIINNIFISKFTDKDLNKTLAQHNITNETITESYYYYNTTLLTDHRIAKLFWVNLSESENSTTHKVLSSAHRRAATVTLSFDFPFYGHLIKNVTIATGGFLYTGDYVHAWLAATQYIAPLMANFDTSLSNDSFVRYMDNGTAFTVVWEKVALKDRADEGEFTFQTTLHKNGDIVFVYKNVPTIIENIKDDQHPVKIGLSDAYIIDSTLFFLRRKTIYEYHRVNFQKEDINNGTVIFLKALPTCLDANDCTTCLTKDLSSFQCVWCPALKRCSSGVDRHRQEWIMKGCDQMRFKNVTYCSRPNSHDADESNSAYIHDSVIYKNLTEVNTSFSKQSNIVATQPNNIGISGVLAIMILMTMIVAISMWIFYAYRNPHTTSGQMLIRYRPTQWRWKRGEARYTAATIHM